MLNQLSLHQDRSNQAAQRLDALTKRLEQTIKQQEAILNSVAGLATFSRPQDGAGGGGGGGGGGRGGDGFGGAEGIGHSEGADREDEYGDHGGVDDVQAPSSPSRQGALDSPHASEDVSSHEGDVSGGFSDARGYPGSRSSTRKRASFKLREIPEEGKIRTDTKAFRSVKGRTSDSGKKAVTHRRASETLTSLVTSDDVTTRFSFDDIQTLSLDVKPQSPLDVSSKSPTDASPKSSSDVVPTRSPFDVKVEFKDPCDVMEARASSADCDANGTGEGWDKRL